jgi:hypothetical protein
MVDAENDEYKDDIILTPQTEPIQKVVSHNGK